MLGVGPYGESCVIAKKATRERVIEMNIWTQESINAEIDRRYAGVHLDETHRQVRESRRNSPSRWRRITAQLRNSH